VSADDATAKLATAATNGAGTSLIFFQGSEDLGGGLKAEFKGQNVFAALSPTNANTSTGYQSGAFFNDEVWAGLSGGFGAVKIGAPTTATHSTAGGVIQPFATSLGSGWESTGVSRFGAGNANKYGVNAFPGSDYRIVRVEKSIRYDTPVFNGFSASYVWAGKNANSTTASSNTAGFGEVGLKYSAGPLNLSYVSAKTEVGANGVATAASFAAAAASTVFPANSSVKYTTMGGNYTIGNLTAYYGATTAKGDGTVITGLDTSSTNIAAKYQLTPVVSVAFNNISINDKATANKDQKLSALGVNYDLSKRTSLYARYVSYDTDKTLTTKGVTVTAVGVKHTF
jgi:predicted porin